jgi:hypothetical protein
VNIGEYLPRRSRGKYSTIITEPDENNCFSIITQVQKNFKKKITQIGIEGRASQTKFYCQFNMYPFLS